MVDICPCSSLICLYWNIIPFIYRLKRKAIQQQCIQISQLLHNDQCLKPNPPFSPIQTQTGLKLKIVIHQPLGGTHSSLP